MYQGKNSQGVRIRRTLSDNNPTMDRAVHNGADVKIDTHSEEERMQRCCKKSVQTFRDVSSTPPGAQSDLFSRRVCVLCEEALRGVTGLRILLY